MSKQVVRVGDVNNAGGAALSAIPKVTVDSRPIARYGTRVAPHPCCGSDGCGIHCNAVGSFPGSSKVTVQGLPVLRVGDRDSCGHVRATGSARVTVN